MIISSQCSHWCVDEAAFCGRRTELLRTDRAAGIVVSVLCDTHRTPDSQRVPASAERGDPSAYTKVLPAPDPPRWRPVRPAR